MLQRARSRKCASIGIKEIAFKNKSNHKSFLFSGIGGRCLKKRNRKNYKNNGSIYINGYDLVRSKNYKRIVSLSNVQYIDDPKEISRKIETSSKTDIKETKKTKFDSKTNIEINGSYKKYVKGSLTQDIGIEHLNELTKHFINSREDSVVIKTEYQAGKNLIIFPVLGIQTTAEMSYEIEKDSKVIPETKKIVIQKFLEKAVFNYRMLPKGYSLKKYFKEEDCIIQ